MTDTLLMQTQLRSITFLLSQQSKLARCKVSAGCTGQKLGPAGIWGLRKPQVEREGRQGGRGEGRSEQSGGAGPLCHRPAATDGTAARTPREMVERLAARLLAGEARGGESSPTNESEPPAPPNQWMASLFPSRAVVP